MRETTLSKNEGSIPGQYRVHGFTGSKVQGFGFKGSRVRVQRFKAIESVYPEEPMF
jgi:hypothetical protein